MNEPAAPTQKGGGSRTTNRLRRSSATGGSSTLQHGAGRGSTGQGGALVKPAACMWWIRTSSRVWEGLCYCCTNIQHQPGRDTSILQTPTFHSLGVLHLGGSDGHHSQLQSISPQAGNAVNSSEVTQM